MKVYVLVGEYDAYGDQWSTIEAVYYSRKQAELEAEKLQQEHRARGFGEYLWDIKETELKSLPENPKWIIS